MGNVDTIAARAPGTTVAVRPSAPDPATAPSSTEPSSSATRFAEALSMEWFRSFWDEHVLLDRETLSLLASVGSVLTTVAWVMNR